jgi:hypothetical protein
LLAVLGFLESLINVANLEVTVNEKEREREREREKRLGLGG